MIAILKPDCPVRVKADIVRLIEAAGLRVQVSEHAGTTTVGVAGPGAVSLAERLATHPGVAEIRPESRPYPLVSRDHHPEPSRVRVGGVVFGADRSPVVIAGPCAVESRDQILEVARRVADAGARMLRGGAFKPRTSPYSFQGLGERGLELLAEARERTGLGIVTEVVAPDDVELVSGYADMLQVGARNMQNFRLLQAVGERSTAVLLKRGLMSNIDEWLGAAEYVVAAGNSRVVLCERGIRTFETATRNTLDVSSIPVLRERSHLPVIADPSHAAGRREWVASLSRAALAAGADGLVIEVHPDPENALSDGRQSLDPASFRDLMGQLRQLSGALGRPFAGATEAAVSGPMARARGSR